MDIVKHSPGPWIWGGDIDDNEYVFKIDRVRCVCMRYSGNTTDQAIANARLIAAAPDLLAACKAALGAFEHNHAINWDDLTRAIERAEGPSESR